MRHFQKLRHVLPNLSPKHSYEQLKTALLQHYAPSEDENLECLLHQTRLTSKITPSQLLDRMRSLIGEDHAPERLLCKLFLDQLLASVRRIIAAHPRTDLDELAATADRIVAEYHDSVLSNAGSGEMSSRIALDRHHNQKLAAVCKQLAQLNISISFLSNTIQAPTPIHTSTPNWPRTLPPRRQSPLRLTFPHRDNITQRTAPSIRSRPATSPHPPTHNDPAICFYHQRFGDKALKCQGNCAWQGRRRSTVRSPRAFTINSITASKEGWNVRDPNTAIVFVIDSGSPHSLFPCTRPTSDHRYYGELTTANGSKIPTFEREQLHLTLGLGKSFT